MTTVDFTIAGVFPWTAPDDGELLVTALGGGGGGAGGQAIVAGGGGGGGGALAATFMTVTAGQVYTVVVGAGGARGAFNGGGAAAGAVSGIALGGTVLVSAAGGKPGNGTAAGAGGTVADSVGTVRIAGSAGVTSGGGAGGKGGDSASNADLPGGVGGNGGTPGATGGTPGAGGGGGSNQTGGAGGVGGVGKVRLVFVEFPLPTIGSHLDVMTTPGSFQWRAPATGRYLVQAEGAGGGGRGGVLLTTGGGGGGGGAYAHAVIDAVEGQWYSGQVGSGGNGGPFGGGAGGSGGNGGASTFSLGATVLVRAAGGYGSTGITGAPGGDVAGSIGDVRTVGYAGLARPDASAFNAGNGGGGARPFGGLGGANAGQGAGVAGAAPGGGGSGGGAGSDSNGGAGARGEVRIAYLYSLGSVSVAGERKILSRVSRIVNGQKVALEPYRISGGVKKAQRASRPDRDQALLAHPSWLVTDDRPKFERPTGRFNWKVGAAKLRAAIASGVVDIACVGDSLTEGFTYLNSVPPFDFAADRANAYPMRMRARLASAGLTIGGTGLVRVQGALGSRDPRWTVASVSDGGHYVTVNSGGYAEFASDRPGSSVAVVVFDAGGTINLQVDGGPVINVPLVGTFTTRRLVFNDLAATTHTVRVTPGTGTPYVVGADVYTPGGLRVHNVAQGGATARGTGQASWSNVADAATMLNVFSSPECYGRAPDASLIMVGTNDMGGSSAKDYDGIAAAYQTIGRKFAGPNSDVVLLTPPHFSSTFATPAGYSNPLFSRMMTLALAEGWALIDLEWLTGGYENLAGLFMTGDVYGHFNNYGADHIGQHVGNAIVTP